MKTEKENGQYPKAQTRLLGTLSATSIVVASMVGTGIFTTSGFIVSELNSPFLLLFVWLIGGILALFGALSYAELAAAMPMSGGEYNYLSKIYHPAVGFLSGWISLIAGFSAPIASVSLAFGKYLFSVMPFIHPKIAALALVLIFSMLHLVDIRMGSYTQNFFTIIKIVLILGFIILGFLIGMGRRFVLMPTLDDLQVVISPKFGVALILVSFAYSGWNASTYIAGEIKDPERNLPRSLFLGTLIVIILYLGLNLLYIYAMPIKEMAGKIEVGHIAAVNLFGQNGGNFLALLIALALVSTASAMIMAGPRVYQAVGMDIPAFKLLACKTKRGAPAMAIILQTIIAMFLIITTTFESLILYIGFTLGLFSWLTVFGVYIFRYRKPNTKGLYHTWGYPITPALFLLLNGWMLIYTLLERPVESLAGLATIVLGLIIYLWSKKRQVFS